MRKRITPAQSGTLPRLSRFILNWLRRVMLVQQSLLETCTFVEKVPNEICKKVLSFWRWQPLWATVQPLSISEACTGAVVTVFPRIGKKAGGFSCLRRSLVVNFLLKSICDS